MSTALSAVRVILGLTVLTMSYYLSFLTLKHIEATELMWFIYWVMLPFAIVVAIAAALIDGEAQKNAIRKALKDMK